MILCEWYIIKFISHCTQERIGFVSTLAVCMVAVPMCRHWSPFSMPICASSCLISQVRQRYSCIRQSSEAHRDCGCKPSKRVQLSWQDAWELSSDLATQEAFLSAFGSLGFCSHDMTQYCSLSTWKFSPKDTEVVWYRNSEVNVILTDEETQIS